MSQPRFTISASFRDPNQPGIHSTAETAESAQGCAFRFRDQFAALKSITINDSQGSKSVYSVVGTIPPSLRLEFIIPPAAKQQLNLK